MFIRLYIFFSRKFGPKWMEDEKTFWNRVASGVYEPEPIILKKK